MSNYVQARKTRQPRVYDCGEQPGGVQLVRARNRVCVAVTVTSLSWVDWPIMYDDGTVTYDAPHRVPLAWRDKVKRYCRIARRMNAGLPWRNWDEEPARPVFCGPGCRESYREDRRQGLVYGSVQDEDGKVYGWSWASELFGFCAYCREQLRAPLERGGHDDGTTPA